MLLVTGFVISVFSETAIAVSLELPGEMDSFSRRTDNSFVTGLLALRAGLFGSSFEVSAHTARFCLVTRLAGLIDLVSFRSILRLALVLVVRPFDTKGIVLLSQISLIITHV